MQVYATAYPGWPQLRGKEVDREILFAKTLEKVKKKGRMQGNRISKEQVREAFEELALEEAQLTLVYDYLEKHHIGVDRANLSETHPEAFGEGVYFEENLTEEETDYLQEYVKSLQELPVLSGGEKEAVFLASMAGEVSAQKRLVEAFLPQVADMAKIYAGQGVYLEDLIGQGNMALSEGVSMLGAAENAKDAEGMLAWLIMDAMEKLIGEGQESRNADKKLEDKVNHIAKQAKELAEDLRRKVTIKELAEETGTPEEEIRDVYRLSGYVIEDIEDK